MHGRDGAEDFLQRLFRRQARNERRPDRTNRAAQGSGVDWCRTPPALRKMLDLRGDVIAMSSRNQRPHLARRRPAKSPSFTLASLRKHAIEQRPVQRSVHEQSAERATPQPFNVVIAVTTPSTAASRSASLSTTRGLFLQARAVPA